MRIEFLSNWESEEITNIINYTKKDLNKSILVKKDLIDTCNNILEFFISYFNTLKENRVVVSIFYPFSLIREYLAHINVMIDYWGREDEYLDYLIDITREILKKITITNYPLISEANKLIDEFRTIDFEQKINILIKKWKEKTEKALKLNGIYDSFKEYAPSRESFKLDKSIPISPMLESFNKFRDTIFFGFRYLTEILIPSLLQALPSSEKFCYKILCYYYDQIMIDLNHNMYFSSSIRYLYRMNKKSYINILLRNKQAKYVLEIFGNLPVFSIMASLIGINSTVIDYDFDSKGTSIVGTIKNALDVIIDNKDVESGFNKIKNINYEVIEKNPDISFNKIHPKALEHFEYLNKDKKLNLKIIEKNLLDPDIVTFLQFGYDCIFFDPPYDKKTKYMKMDIKILIKTAIKLSLNMKSKIGHIYCSMPIDPQIRNKFIEIFDEMELKYKIPGKKQRFIELNQEDILV